MSSYIALKGNLTEGYTAIGPYPSFDAAANDQEGWDVWITTLEKPATTEPTVSIWIDHSWNDDGDEYVRAVLEVEGIELRPKIAECDHLIQNVEKSLEFIQEWREYAEKHGFGFGIDEDTAKMLEDDDDEDNDAEEEESYCYIGMHDAEIAGRCTKCGTDFCSECGQDGRCAYCSKDEGKDV